MIVQGQFPYKYSFIRENLGKKYTMYNKGKQLLILYGDDPVCPNDISGKAIWVSNIC
jgi:hypothetical protein